MSTKQVNLYQIDVTFLNEKLEDLKKNKIESVFSFSNYSKASGYDKIKLDLELPTLEEAVLYFDNSKNVSPWKDFLNNISPVKADIQKLKGLLSKEQSMISFCLVLNFKTKKKDNRMFAFCGGHGRFLLSGLISNLFGIEVFMRIFENKEVIALSTGERMLSGSVLSSVKNFRKDWRLDYEDEIGKIYSNLASPVKTETLKPLMKGIKGPGAEVITCIGNNTFQLKRALTALDSARLASNINKLFDDFPKPKVYFSGVIKISKKSEEIKRLNGIVLKNIYEYACKNKSKLNFDFIPQEGENDFLACSEFQLLHSSKRKSVIDFESVGFDLQSIVDALLGLSNSPLKKEGVLLKYSEFEEAFLDLRFKFLDQNDVVRIYSLINLISGEINDDTKYYFKLETSYYEVVENYLKKLNEAAQNVVKRVENKELLHKWKWGSADNEYTYIQKLFKEKKVVILHTIKIKNIELCDLLIIDEENERIHIVHVKDGLDVKMRDLHQQVYVSTLLIEESAKSDGRVLKDLYKAILNKSKKMPSAEVGYKINYNNQLIDHCKEIVEKYTEPTFVKLFQRYTRVYCAAVYAGGGDKPFSEKVKSTTSNIAKQSIIQMRKDSSTIIDYGESLKIIEIK